MALADPWVGAAMPVSIVPPVTPETIPEESSTALMPALARWRSDPLKSYCAGVSPGRGRPQNLTSLSYDAVASIPPTGCHAKSQMEPSWAAGTIASGEDSIVAAEAAAEPETFQYDNSPFRWPTAARVS
jgi:hypothetical protein